MKKQRIIRLEAALGLWLWLMALSASAFYNPTVGRWLNRDPRGESGGISLCSFLGNRTPDRSDYLGLDFYWDSPELTTKPAPIKVYEDPVDPKKDQYITGEADWKYFNPRVVAGSGGQSCPCGTCLFVYGSATAKAWWARNHWRAQIHELGHVEEMRTAALDFKADAESFQGICYTKDKANCLKSVIEKQMKNAYMAQAKAVGARFDCSDYGNNDPTNFRCREAAKEMENYLRARTELAEALGKCGEGAHH